MLAWLQFYIEDNGIAILETCKFGQFLDFSGAEQSCWMRMRKALDNAVGAIDACGCS